MVVERTDDGALGRAQIVVEDHHHHLLVFQIDFTMHALHVLISVFLLPVFIDASVPFTMNPGCDLPACKEYGHTALYYTEHLLGDDAIHIIYSSFSELTISVFQTKKNAKPTFNYTALFEDNFLGAVQFDGTKPDNSLSIVLRRLIEFVDNDDNGLLNDNDNITATHWIGNVDTTNVTFTNTTSEQPMFKFPLEMLNGTLTVDIVYEGDKKRDTKFPKLITAPKSIFLNIALQAEGFVSAKTRFALEILQAVPAKEASRIFSSRFIDDQYTPGIFSVWQFRTQNPMYPASMLWKPVVYQSEDRTIEQNTLMHVYALKNNFTLNSSVDQGIYYSLNPQPIVSAFNVSLGQANDGFFTKTNYTFIQFTAGLDLLEPDSTVQFVTIALIISLALPMLVGLIALIFIVRRRFSQTPTSSYGAIRN